MGMAAVVVGAVAVHDWAPKLVLPAVGGVVMAADDDAQVRLRLELWEKVRSVGPTEGRDLLRYAEARPEAPLRREARPETAAVGQTKKGDRLSYEEHAETFPLRFYGYARRRAGRVRALFCDDELVYLASEGDVIRGRYRVVRIEELAAEVEDLAAHTRRTLALEDAVPS